MELEPLINTISKALTHLSIGELRAIEDYAMKLRIKLQEENLTRLMKDIGAA